MTAMGPVRMMKAKVTESSMVVICCSVPDEVVPVPGLVSASESCFISAARWRTEWMMRTLKMTSMVSGKNE